MSPAKTAELIKVPFGLRTGVGPGNHVLDGVQIRPWEGGRQFRERNGRPIVKYRDTLWSSVQKWLNQLRCCLGCGSDEPKESCVRWGSRDAKRRCHGNYFFGFQWAITSVV